jgi:TolB-like protein/Tfp pilus assembly protein PilF
VNPRNFLAELKRRNVYKVAVAYAVVAWLLIQVASIVFPTFDAPPAAMKILMVLLAIGFPIALAFSWAFEITSEGIKRESEVEVDKSITRHTGRKIVGITLVLAVIAAGLLVFQLLRSKGEARDVGAPRQNASAARNEAATAITEKSIAVLPFENLSSDKENAYFAEGIQDEILTRLSKIGALKVISRTSTQKYKSAPDNLREIANQLGVANILEGSVQKIGNAAHINVQLIRAASDEHLWAESYNRKLDDVFGVEGEVASAIADQLKAKLSGAEQKAVAEKPTENLAAYDSYLRGLSIEHDRYGYNAYAEAAAAYKRAVELDSNFALAWARLAVIQSFLFFNGIDVNTNSATNVKAAADKASALQPELAEAWVAQGAYRYRVQRDFAGALQAYDEARRRLPNSALVYQYMAYVQRRLGRWDDAAVNYKKAAELDPQNVQLFVSEGSEFLVYRRRYDEALVALDRALQISPGELGALTGKAYVFQQQGRLPEASAILAQVPPATTDDIFISIQIEQDLYERRYDKLIERTKRKLDSASPSQPFTSFTQIFVVDMGFCQEWTGHHADALRTFNQVVSAIKPTPDTVVAPEANGLPSTLALAYAGLGEKEKALAQARQAVADYDTDAVNKPAAEVVLAQIQAHFGDLDSAIAALPHLLEVPAGTTRADLKFNPFWDPLRKDSRFQKLCQQPAK